MPRLTKRDVERLTDDYDADPVAALTRALRVITATAGASWAELVEICPLPLRAGLANHEIATLDALLRLCIETRGATISG
jgi:hypothetical protein